MDADDMEGAMLREAIAASLRDRGKRKSSPPRFQRGIVDLTRDSDDESDVCEIIPKSKSVIGSDTDEEAEDDGVDQELERAIQLSLGSDDKVTKDNPINPIESPQKPNANSSTFLGLDRKQMEEERLARVAKRKAETSASPQQEPQPKTPKLEVTPTPQPVTPRASVWDSAPNAPQALICDRHAANDPSFPVQPIARPVPQWPLGAVKKTCVSDQPRKGDDITLEEVFQRGDLELAVLSSYLWDMDWVFDKVDMGRTRLYLVMHAKEEETRREWQEDIKHMPSIRLCFPPMDGQVNCMHSKLMLLFRSNSLRLVVPTANLTPHDWGESNLMENTVFLIDLPKKSPEKADGDSKTPFYEDLLYFLKESALHPNIISKLEKFDFSKTARYAFVHSIGGSHPTKDAWQRTGYPGLGHTVSRFGLATYMPINVNYVTSSVGSLTDEFLRAIYLACKGDSGMTNYNIRNTKVSSQDRTSVTTLTEESQTHFQVYFPSDRTAHTAHREPQETAGTICFQRKWWDGAKFPRRVMKDCESHRGVLMHNKLIFVWPSQPLILEDDTKCQGWVYVGSANLSESAWGRLVKDRATGQPKLNCRNWECGVLVPVTNPDEEGKSDDSSQSDETVRASSKSPAQYLPAEVFQNTVPVPMKLPAAPLKEGREPWFLRWD